MNHKSVDVTTPMFSNDKNTAIVMSEGGFLFVNLKTKQGKIIGTTRMEAIEKLDIMGRSDDFPLL